MAMKLLKKQEIVQAKARDMQREVQEGLKLAKRVDSLREVQAQEEESLRNFREKTLFSIHQETTKASNERDALLTEVALLKEERDKALEPLTKEWGLLGEAKQALLIESETLTRERKEVEAIRQGLVTTLEVSLEKEQKIATTLGQIQLLGEETHRNKEASTIALIQAEKTQKEALSLKHLMEEQISSHTAQSIANEQRQALRDAQQDAREQELNARETRLADREGTLERNIKRNGN
jgi:hypothetical protein